MNIRVATQVLAALAALSTTIAYADVPQPQGFRGPPYAAEVPADLTGATVITPAEALTLHQQGVAFIDVYPGQKKPDGLPAGTIWHPAPHLTIPGALWLYDTGYQSLSPVEEARLAEGLAQASHGNKDAPMVMFCRADCWMSWNAGKRAVALGYRDIRWFPGGTDEWQALGQKLEPVSPDVP